MKLREVLLGAFLAVHALSGVAHADKAPQEVTISEQDNMSEYQSVMVYGHELDLGAVKMDEGNDTLTWSELKNMVPRTFANVDEKVSVEEMCTRVFMTHDTIRNKTESYRNEMIAAYAKHYHEQGIPKEDKYEEDQLLFDQEMIDVLNETANEGVEALIAKLPAAERLVMKARDYTRMWGVAEIIHDAAIQSCPEFANAIGRNTLLSWEEEAAVEQPSPDTPKP